MATERPILPWDCPGCENREKSPWIQQVVDPDELCTVCKKEWDQFPTKEEIEAAFSKGELSGRMFACRPRKRNGRMSY